MDKADFEQKGLFRQFISTLKEDIGKATHFTKSLHQVHTKGTMEDLDTLVKLKQI